MTDTTNQPQKLNATAYEVAAKLCNINADEGFAQVVGEALLHYKVTALAGKASAQKKGDTETAALCNNRYNDAKAALEFIANSGWDRCYLPACYGCAKEPVCEDPNNKGLWVCESCGVLDGVEISALTRAPQTQLKYA